MHALVRHSQIVLVSTRDGKRLLAQRGKWLSVDAIQSTENLLVFIWIWESDCERSFVFVLFDVGVQSRSGQCIVKRFPHTFHHVFVLKM